MHQYYIQVLLPVWHHRSPLWGTACPQASVHKNQQNLTQSQQIKETYTIVKLAFLRLNLNLSLSSCHCPCNWSGPLDSWGWLVLHPCRPVPDLLLPSSHLTGVWQLRVTSTQSDKCHKQSRLTWVLHLCICWGDTQYSTWSMIRLDTSPGIYTITLFPDL